MKQGLCHKTTLGRVGLTLLAVLVMVGCGGGGGVSPLTPPTNDNPVPSISTISPTSSTVGAAAGTLTINGSNFMSTSTVTYHGVSHTATFVSASQLTIALTTNDQATAGAYAVVVANPSPGGGDSNSVSFTVNNLAPRISSLSPTSAAAGAAGQTLTLNGTNFLSTSTVTYNAAAHPATFVSATQLTIALTAGDQATAGAFPVVVTNPTPGGGASSAASFNVDNPVPTVTSLSPTSAPVGAAAQTLTINATKFLSTSTETYTGTAHTATFVSATKLTIALTTGDQATAGTFPVVVKNPTPGGGSSSTVDFAVGNPIPSIASLSPTSATAGAAAQTLTINGTDFMNSSTVTYNGVGHAATFVSATKLTISLTTGDQATAGTFPVVVKNPTPGGGTSTAVSFTVNNPAPTIASISPTSATAGAAAQTLTINGTNFLHTSTVTYNATAHTATFVSVTKLTIFLTTGDQATAGNRAVVVSNPAPGGGNSNSVNFVVNAATPVTVTLDGQASSSTSVAVGGTLHVTAVVTGAAPNLTFTVNGVTNGNATVGTISGSSSPYTYTAPSAIPANENPVTIEAMQGGTGDTASLSVTINPSNSSPNAIKVTGGVATGINLSLTNRTPTLGLADVGTCNYPTANMCTANVTGIQISRSGQATNFCGNSSCTIWLLGQGLTNGSGSALASGLTLSVTHPQSATDVTVGTVQSNAPISGLTNIFIPITVSSSAPLGIRDIVVTLGDGETQVYTGAIQIVN